MKKILSIILLLCMLLTVVACNNDKGKNEETTVGEEETNVETSYLDTLPELDLQYANFNILVTTQLVGFYDQENESGDIVDNACYMRNLDVEERYKIDITYSNLDGNASGANQFASAITNSLQADAQSRYDLILGQNYYCLPLVASNAWHNLRTSEIINWDAEWYHQSINNNGTVNGNLYGASGSFVIAQLAYATALIYNKDIYTNYGLADKYDVYQLVRDKKWTWDVFYEMATSFDSMTFDNPADSVWGYNVYDHAAVGLSTGLGINFAEQDGDGNWTFDNFYNDKLETIYGKIREFLNDHASCATTQEILDAGIAYKDFMSHVLFCQGYIHGLQENEAQTPREGLTLGVLVSPMYTEEQGEYRTRVMRDELFYIPTNANLYNSSLIVEALNYETRQQVYPEYWEKVMELRSADTSEDKEMLEILESTVYFSFADYFSQDLQTVDNQVGLQAMNNAASFNNWWKTNGKIVSNRLIDLIETYGAQPKA
ncbi:MAG: extracellular solute-binding protein [Clostridia bacterium]|nr:extracellular solute-binding protein [Clostridia bacterium]